MKVAQSPISRFLPRVFGGTAGSRGDYQQNGRSTSIVARSLRIIERPLRWMRSADYRHSVSVRTRGRFLGIKLRLSIRRLKQSVIAISLLEHMGDIVACEPVARRAREAHPDAYIIWCTRAPYVDLLRHNPDIDRIIVVRCTTEWMRLRDSARFNSVIDLNLPDRWCLKCGLPSSKNGGDTRVTLGNYFSFGGLLETLSLSAGLPALRDPPRIHIPGSVRRSISELELPPRFVVIHCKSNEPVKDWLASKWRDLVARLWESRQIPVVEVGLQSVCAAAMNNTSAQVINLCGRLSLLETAEVIRRAALFVGIDSGPAHLANAAGTRGVVLLGHYRDFETYVPYSGGYADGSNAELVRALGSVTTIDVDQVAQAIHSQLASGGFVAKAAASPSDGVQSFD